MSGFGDLFKGAIKGLGAVRNVAQDMLLPGSSAVTSSIFTKGTFFGDLFGGTREKKSRPVTLKEVTTDIKQTAASQLVSKYWWAIALPVLVIIVLIYFAFKKKKRRR